MSARIIADHPLAHEEVMRAWDAYEKCVVVPSGFHDPSSYVEAHPGGPGLFNYIPNRAGGHDLIHIPWAQLERRFEGETLKPYVGRVYTLTDNRWGYGLIAGRLYMLYHGGTVVPYYGSPARLCETIDEAEVTTLIGIASFIAAHLVGRPRPQKGTLTAIINICRPFTAEELGRIEQHFGVKVHNHFGLAPCGTIAFSDGRALEEHEVGDLIIPAELRGEELFVRSPSTYPQFDLGDGWCATGKRARIDGRRLFVLGDVA